MNARDFDPRDPMWTAYLLGELSAEHQAAVEQVLATSPAARRFLGELGDSADQVKAALANQAAPSLAPERRAAVLLAIGRGEGVGPAGKPRELVRRGWRRGKLAPALSLAALLLLTVGLTYGVHRAGNRQVATGTSRSTELLNFENSEKHLPGYANEVSENKKSSRDIDYTVKKPTYETKTKTYEDGDSRRANDLPTSLSHPVDDRQAPVSGGGEQAEAVMMQVTPSIIVQEEEESLLGEASQDGRNQPMATAGGGKGAGQAAAPYSPTRRRPSQLGRASRLEASPSPVKRPVVAAEVRIETLTVDPPTTVFVEDLATTGNPLASPHDWRYPSQRRGVDQVDAEAYEPVVDNPFLGVKDHPLSTFSVDVDTASYANIRRFLTQNRQLPPPSAVRIEEMVNYFPYHYAAPTDDKPFAVHTEVAGCPWSPQHRLLRIGVKGREIAADKRPVSNLVFLLDVSGSMDEPNKLPLVKEAVRMLVGRLTENDRVAIVVYAGASGMVLPSVTGDQKSTILEALDRLAAGGSTNGGAGMELAYGIAAKHFIKGGTNRVILATDGDFNVGVTDREALVRLVEEKAKSGVFLTALGFGMGNLKDATLEQLADKGNGNYAYIDREREARKVFVEQMSSTLVTIAKDVKLQLEFNPAQVASYRLIGYENRALRNEDFNNDKKDAGDIGAGHTVTALYELTPAQAAPGDRPAVDALKYQRPVALAESAQSGELLTLKVRYKQPDGERSELIEQVVKDGGQGYFQASGDFKFASAVALFGMLLRDSPYHGEASFDTALELAREGRAASREADRGKPRPRRRRNQQLRRRTIEANSSSSSKLPKACRANDRRARPRGAAWPKPNEQA